MKGPLALETFFAERNKATPKLPNIIEQEPSEQNKKEKQSTVTPNLPIIPPQGHVYNTIRRKKTEPFQS